ncbi:MAG: GCG_CRPN prefix-to-repeats domain-containing protein [Methylocella sp.]
MPLPLRQPFHVTQIAGGRGPGWHRGPRGGCRRNWGAWRRCYFRRTPRGPRRICRW